MLGRFWWLHGHHVRDGVDWLERILDGRALAEVAVDSTARVDAEARHWAGVLHESVGDLRSAAERLEEALEQSGASDNPTGEADTVDEIAGIALDRGDAASAVRLFLAADGQRSRHALTVRSIDVRRRAPRVSTAKAALSEAAIEAMEAEARVMNISAALAVARLTTG